MLIRAPPTPSNKSPHHHFGIVPDRSDEIGQVTIPCAFSNYEVLQPNGIWKFMNRGIPQQNEVVRRVNPMLGWDHIGHANYVIAMTSIFVATLGKPKLFAVTKDNKLWWRDPVGFDINWNHIGYARDVVGIAASSNKLFAVTKDNKLRKRDPIDLAPTSSIGSWIGSLLLDGWVDIGFANDVVAMTASNSKVFAATNGNKLKWTDPNSPPRGGPWPMLDGWEEIGHAIDVTAMAFWAPLRNEHDCGCDGLAKLFAVTKDTKLWWRDAVGDNNSTMESHRLCK